MSRKSRRRKTKGSLTGAFRFCIDAETADKPDSVNATRAAPDNHSSRRRITTPLKLPTRRLPGAPLPAHAQGACRSPAYLELLRVEVTVPCALPHAAVRSYRTVSPLPDPPGLRQGPSAVCSLLPCSASHDGWPLAITLPYGVRTFLPLPKKAAIVWPTLRAEVYHARALPHAQPPRITALAASPRANRPDAPGETPTCRCNSPNRRSPATTPGYPTPAMARSHAA